MVTEVIFDIETKKLFSDITSDDPGLLGVSIVSAYKRTLSDNLEETSGEMRSFWENDLPQLFEWFNNADRIIGFNTFKFDVPALQPYSSLSLITLPHFDIFELVRQKVGKKLPLNALALETLGVEKVDSGINAVLYWANHNEESLRKLQTYCEADVDITKRLYDFGLKNRHLKYKDKWNQSVKIEIDFSYPIKETPPQIGLF